MHDDPHDPETTPLGREVHEAAASMLPWMTSVLFHLGLMVLAMFVVFFAMTERQPEPMIDVHSHVHDPNRARLTPSDDPLAGVESPDIRRIKRQTPDNESLEHLTGVLNSSKSDLELGDFSPVSDGPIAPNPAGPGPSTMFDPPSREKFSSVVYVIDASGSLVAEMGFVIDQLKASIRKLGPDQTFTVIFFQRDFAIETPPRGMKPATDAYKKRILDWISTTRGNIVPGGTSNPITALDIALRYEPQAVFVLSDNITGRGRYEVDRQKLLGELARLNADQRTRIHTIQFLYPDPLNTLQQIAKRHGGVFRRVEEADLLGR